MGDVEANNNYQENNNEQTVLINGHQDDFAETPIQRFYAGQRIFITGGTGFLGKILVEKLLRSCPAISKIYLLVRAKKGKDSDSRFGELFDSPVFERLRKMMPDFREKIVAVTGDIASEGLALSEEDAQLLAREVSIVFHVAATVRFDEELKLALSINVRGTREVIALCEKMSKLKAVIHVSTAFANCHLRHIDEKFYDYPIGHKEILELADTLPQDELVNRTSKYLKDWPNTYTVTKAIAESLVRDRSHHLPAGIFRPAIVISTCQEPIPGWIDNLYGPTGIMAGAMAGLIRIINCDPQATADLIPVDLTVNALIVSAWDVYSQRQRRNKEIPIYNYVSSVEAPLNWLDFRVMTADAVAEYPLETARWHFANIMIRNQTLYNVAGFLCHFLPAAVIDFGSMCIGKKPRLYKTYTKIYKYLNAIAHFSVSEWYFTNDNTRAMWQRIGEKDKQIYPFSMKGFNWKSYFYDYVLGVRTYVLKEDPATIPASKLRMTRLYWIHKAVKYFLFLGALSAVRKAINMMLD